MEDDTDAQVDSTFFGFKQTESNSFQTSMNGKCQHQCDWRDIKVAAMTSL